MEIEKQPNGNHDGSLEEELRKFDEKIEDAKTNLGDVEVRDAIVEKAEFLERRGELDRAIAIYQEAMKFTISIGKRMDLVFAVLKIYMARGDQEQVKVNIGKAKELLEAGGDWERKNKLKVYEGVYLLMTREFNTAALLFIDCLATFNSAEIISFKDLILYTALSGIVSLDRTEIRKKIIQSSEVLSVIREIPGLKVFLDSFYKCDYAAFFQVLPQIIEHISADKYLSLHKRYLVREIRIVVYKQFLESYKTVTLDNMASAFGVSAEFIDRELSEFISTKRIACKIDKVAGQVESQKLDDRNSLYNRALRQGDLLLHRIQKLSRIIES